MRYSDAAGWKGDDPHFNAVSWNSILDLSERPAEIPASPRPAIFLLSISRGSHMYHFLKLHSPMFLSFVIFLR